MIPIQPEFHRILFPDHQSEADRQLPLFKQVNNVGNAIKLAYLCHAQTKHMSAGDIVLFYRSGDEKSITSIGIVEDYQTLEDPMGIAQLVSRRTVYSMDQIKQMAQQNTRVMLFRLISHFDKPLSFAWLKSSNVVKGSIRSIQLISNEGFERVIEHAGI